MGDDVRVISEQNVWECRDCRAIEDLLAGKTPSNRLHTAALDAAQGYLEGRAGYRGPELPLDETGGLAGMAARESSRGGGERPRVDDFEAFSRIFDDVAPSPGGEPGESGFIMPELATHIGGGIAGAAAGAASGETTEERVKRGILFGAAGAAAPALLRRRSGPSTAPASSPATRVPATVLSMSTPGTVPRVRRSGDPMRDPLKGTEVLLGKFSNPLVRPGIEERLTANHGYATQRRGTISNTDLGTFASQVRVDVTQALPKGSAVTGEVVTAYARAAQETQRRVSELASKVNAGNATDTDHVVRQPEGIVEQIAAATPGLSTSVPPRISRFGEVVTREGRPVRRAADPFNISSAVEDPMPASSPGWVSRCRSRMTA